MLVAVEPNQKAGGVTLYHRTDGELWSEEVGYQPWMLVPSIDEQIIGSSRFTPLRGEGYNRLVEFPKWKAFYQARRLASDADMDVLSYVSPAKNFLVRSGMRMFAGGSYDQLVRLVVDIETTGLDPYDSEILMIALLTNDGTEICLVGDEKSMLEEFARQVRFIDPDTIEGHNLYAFDLPFIITRAMMNGVDLAIGRDLSAPRIGRERRIMIGPNEKMFSPIYIQGRHVLDTFLQVQKYDVATQRHMSYGLKAVAREYDIAEPNRIELDRSKIEDLYRDVPDTVKLYAMQDVRETLRLADIVFPVEFYQTQTIPDGYTGVATTGNGAKWDSLLVGEYIARGRAIPFRTPQRSYIGGFVECRRTGVMGPIVKADVESLYPSLMLGGAGEEIRSKKDTLNLMLPTLRRLLDQRLDAKRKMKTAKGAEKDFFDGLQGSFKILINSAYGYLGAPTLFNDQDAAEKVTTTGREVVTKIADAVTAKGGTVVEIDTDGVMFIPPPEIDNEDKEFMLVRQVETELAEQNGWPGIHIAHDGRYQKMLSLAMKNYALLDYKGKKTVKGASLRSRSAEAYGKKWLDQAIDLAMTGDLDQVVSSYYDLCDRIIRHEVDPQELARRERITEKTRTSPQKKRLNAATAHLSIGDHIMVYERADGTIGDIEAYQGDEDVLYYLEKLWKFADRLHILWGDEFKRVFQKAGKRNLGSFTTRAGVNPQLCLMEV